MRLGLGLGLRYRRALLGEPVLAIPVNSVAPAISGTETQGNVLTTTDGTWTANPPPTFSYQWDANDVVIPAATANQYTLTAGEVGKVVKCVVTATNTEGSTPADSNDSGSIAAAVADPVNIASAAGVATVSGEAAGLDSVAASAGVATALGRSGPTAPSDLLDDSDFDALAVDFVRLLVTIRDVATPANDVADGPINSSIAFTGGTKTIVALSGVLKTRGANTLEQSHDPETPGNVAIGTLIEPIAEASIHLHSADATDVSWVKSGVDVPATDKIDPFGTSTADEIACTAQGDVVRTMHQAYTGLTAGKVTTVSRWIKAGVNVDFVQLAWDADGNGTDGCYCNFQLSTGARGVPQAFAAGTALTARMTGYINGYYRVELAGKIAVGTVGRFSMNFVDRIDADGFEAANLLNNDSVIVFGAQVGPGTEIAGSYIASTTTPVTRAADTIPQILTADFPYANTGPGCVGFKYQILEVPAGNSNIFAIGNSATEELALEQYDDSGSQHRFSIKDGGVQVALIADGPGSADYFAELLTCFSWTTDDAYIKCNEGIPDGTQDVTVTLPTTGGTLLYIGGDSSGGSASIMLKEFVYLPRKPFNIDTEATADGGLPFPTGIAAMALLETGDAILTETGGNLVLE